MNHIPEMIGLATLLLAILGSHARLESRLTRLETLADERAKTANEWRESIVRRLEALEHSR